MSLPKLRPVGYVDPETKRVAVTVQQYAASDLNGDATAYYYREEAEEYGLDPWRLIEGVDAHLAGGSFDIWGVSNWCKTVGPQFVIYVSAADYARLQGGMK